MLLILLVLLAIAIVAFWIDRDNTEEMHILTVIALVLLGLMLISLSPWQVQLLIMLSLFVPKFLLSIFHHLHS